MKNRGSIADQNYNCLNLSDWNIWSVSDKSNNFHQSLFNSSPICISIVLYACVHQSSCFTWATLFFFLLNIIFVIVRLTFDLLKTKYQYIIISYDSTSVYYGVSYELLELKLTSLTE